MRRVAPGARLLLPLVPLLTGALGGCTLAWPVAVPAPPAGPPARAVAHRLELGFSREGTPTLPPEAWRIALKDELLQLGAADPAAVGSPTTLVLELDRELDSGVVSLLLNLASAFLWPHEQELVVRMTGTLVGDGPPRTAVAESELLLRTSSAFLFYPPAWRMLDEGKLEQPEVLDAIRACLRRVLAELHTPPLAAVPTLPPPGPPAALPPPPLGDPPNAPPVTPAAPTPDARQLTPRACPRCDRPAEREWIACPWCGADLPPG